MEHVLFHHGIKGQKWGIKNGPPYPLSSNISNGKKLKSIRLKGKKDNNYNQQESQYKLNASAFLAKVAIHTIRLDAVGLAMDIKRGAEWINYKFRSKEVEKALSKANEVDKKTGLKKKYKNYTPEQDLKMVNPDYKNFDKNSKNNCMLCTNTYELRRRGYEVTAEKASRGYMSSDIKRWFPKAKIETVYNFQKKEIKEVAAEKFKHSGIKEAINKIEKQGVGARGNICVHWTFGGGGHSMHYEITNSGLVIRDAQSNKIYNNPIKILKETKFIQVARLDNVDVDANTIKECVRK